MATHSVTTTVAREASLQAVVDRVNVKRASETPPKPALSATQYLQARTNDVLDSYVAGEQRRTARQKLTPAEQAVLGLGTDDE